MNFTEWAKETAKITNPHIKLPLVRMILLSSIKVILDEFNADKEHADFNIMGIGRFYLNKKLMRYSNLNRTTPEEDTYHWEIRFKPSSSLKAYLNGKRDYETLSVIKNRLFTDEKITSEYNIHFERKDAHKVPKGDYKHRYRGIHNTEIKQMLEQEGISYKELCEVVGISYRTLMRELRHPLTVKNYTRIMKAVEVIKHEREQHIWR